jgi:hypothetical protein
MRCSRPEHMHLIEHSSSRWYRVRPASGYGAWMAPAGAKSHGRRGSPGGGMPTRRRDRLADQIGTVGPRALPCSNRRPAQSMAPSSRACQSEPVPGSAHAGSPSSFSYITQPSVRVARTDSPGDDRVPDADDAPERRVEALAPEIVLRPRLEIARHEVPAIRECLLVGGNSSASCSGLNGTTRSPSGHSGAGGAASSSMPPDRPGRTSSPRIATTRARRRPRSRPPRRRRPRVWRRRAPCDGTLLTRGAAMGGFALSRLNPEAGAVAPFLRPRIGSPSCTSSRRALRSPRRSSRGLGGRSRGARPASARRAPERRP